jgi:hypothetical protein
MAPFRALGALFGGSGGKLEKMGLKLAPDEDVGPIPRAVQTPGTPLPLDPALLKNVGSLRRASFIFRHLEPEATIEWRQQ